MKLPENMPEISFKENRANYKIKLYIKGIARDVTPASLFSEVSLIHNKRWLVTNLEAVTKAALSQALDTKVPIKIIVENHAVTPKEVISNENYLVLGIVNNNKDSSAPRSINNDLVILERLIRE